MTSLTRKPKCVQFASHPSHTKPILTQLQASSRPMGSGSLGASSPTSPCRPALTGRPNAGQRQGNGKIRSGPASHARASTRARGAAQKPPSLQTQAEHIPQSAHGAEETEVLYLHLHCGLPWRWDVHHDGVGDFPFHIHAGQSI